MAWEVGVIITKEDADAIYAQIERISHFFYLMVTEMFDTMILLEIQIKLSQNYYLHLRHWNN